MGKYDKDFRENWLDFLANEEPKQLSQYEIMHGLVDLAKELTNAIRTIRQLDRKVEDLEARVMGSKSPKRGLSDRLHPNNTGSGDSN